MSASPACRQAGSPPEYRTKVKFLLNDFKNYSVTIMDKLMVALSDNEMLLPPTP